MSVWTLTGFAAGFTAIGLIVGAGVVWLCLPWLLAHAGHTFIRTTWTETERLLIARHLRPPRRRLGRQTGRHLERTR